MRSRQSCGYRGSAQFFSDVVFPTPGAAWAVTRCVPATTMSRVLAAALLIVEHHSRPNEDFMDATFNSLPATIGDERPIRVRDAAVFLGVSPQTVYLWVERKQIPHLRVMGRNIRFLKSDLVPFRAQFKQEMENGKA